jgi:very-short-patch-repair endonuclease
MHSGGGRNRAANSVRSLPRLRGRVREGAGKQKLMADFPRVPRWHVSTKQRVRARSLRANSTDTERIIWSALRAHRMSGASFRRQTPIGPYVVDFVCHAAKLVIEIDGGQHFESRQEQRDARRDAYLANKGFRVLRFDNHDVLANREGVLETIAAAIGLAPSLALPRKRGRGRKRDARGAYCDTGTR